MARFPESKAASFLHSALSLEGASTPLDEVLTWYRQIVTADKYTVQQIPFAELDQWYFAEHPYRLAHCSGRFFTIEGIRTQTNYGAISEWDQPIINQPEIGILGMISKTFNGIRHFLMQCKMEPGNVNMIQLSPTVQATRSNYTRVHQGKPPPYLEYFTQPRRAERLVDQLQTEQGALFLRKRNRNMVVDVTEDIPIYDRYCWLTLGQIKHLLMYDNLINMDARTVISCMPLRDAAWECQGTDIGRAEVDNIKVGDYRLTGFAKNALLSLSESQSACHEMQDLLSWLTELKTGCDLSVDRIPLNQVRHWVHTEDEIRHDSQPSFSVMSASIRAESREVASWTQPLLKYTGCGLIGFLIQNICGKLHVLVRASMAPGNVDAIDIRPTVSCAAEDVTSQTDAALFRDVFLQAAPAQIHYCAVQSEEGGRFYHFQNRYMIVELPPDTVLDPPDTFIWMTLAQLYMLLPHGYVNIEARSLLACLPLSHAGAAGASTGLSS